MRELKLWNALKKIGLPFWKSQERGAAAFLFALIFIFILGYVYILVLLNDWNKSFFDAIQRLDRVAFTHELIRFSVIALAYVFISTYRVYCEQNLEIKWRRWLTDYFINKWLEKKAFYFWQVSGSNMDNPDQRIAEDISEFVRSSLDLFFRFLREIITFCSFFFILWNLSSFIELNLGSIHLKIPGDMVWFCFLYASIGTWIIHRIGSPLVNINFLQQKYEADFRYFLVRLRESSEGVALTNGEVVEGEWLKKKFQFVMNNFYTLMKRQRILNFSKNIYNQVDYVLPLAIAAPRLFAKEISFGQLMQINSAFAQILGSISFFINSYDAFAKWRATLDRLFGFLEALDDTKILENRTQALISEETNEYLHLKKLSVFTPDNRRLFSLPELKLMKGSSLCISGVSGSGKTTLLRTIAGIWPYASGEVVRPKESLMLLSQKPTIQFASLKAVISYPLNQDLFLDSEIEEILQYCGLSKHLNKIHEVQNWQQILSPGEQQRIAFARVFLHKPQWIFLDEASSALDDAAETYFYNLLREKCPNITIVSIAHRDNVKRYHKELLDLNIWSSVQ